MHSPKKITCANMRHTCWTGFQRTRWLPHLRLPQGFLDLRKSSHYSRFTFCATKTRSKYEESK
jgi:hypothetical protein